MNLEELKRKIEEKQKPVTVINRGITPLSLLGIAFVVMKVIFFGSSVFKTGYSLTTLLYVLINAL